MADKKPEGWQIPTIVPFAPYIQESFDLNRLDAFVKSLGTTFFHWKATPSPIGLNDRGDYRRNETDVITSNGYVYSFGGKFTATMTGNQRKQVRPNEGALIDSSSAYLVLPRFYDTKADSLSPSNDKCKSLPNEVGPLGDDKCNENGQALPNVRIRLTPGDRLYHDPKVDDLVVNKELMNFSFDTLNIPMFPIVKMDAPIIDSRGINYLEDIDFKICNGNIEWLPNRPNPGIDPDSGTGRTYSIRYLYRAFYYVTSILREVRITDVTEGNVRKSERMAMHVEIMREYIYHNINKSDELNKPDSKAAQSRQVPPAPDKVELNQGIVLVEMTDVDGNE